MLVQSLSSGLIYIGNMRAQTGNRSATGNFQDGTAYQAEHSFTAHRMFIRGSNFAGDICDFLMCIYEVTDLTNWLNGPLRGQTVSAASLAQNELKELALVAPVNIVLGNWYALTVLPNAPGITVGSSVAIAGGLRAFADGYGDGPAANASASFENAIDDEYCVWATN